MKAIEGITLPMLVKLGENEVKSVEDLAGCATDDLAGWTERNPTTGEATRQAGYFDGLEVSREEAEMLIMHARLAAGWIDALPEPAAEDTEEEATEGEAEPATT